MYSITRFGAVTLPIYNTEYTLGTVPADGSGILSVGADVWDSYGSQRAPAKFPMPVRYQGIVSQSTLAALRTEFDGLRALTGQREWLYRTANNDATVQQALARLVSVDVQRSVEHSYHFELIFNFLQLGPWRGNSHSDWRFDSGEVLDDGLTFDATDFQTTFASASAGLTLLNSGNLPVEDAVLTVTAGSGTISNVAVVGTGIDWQILTTVAAGQSLVVDCGSRSVQVNGTDAYRNFSLGNNHSLRNWLYLEPGNTVITTTLTGTYTGAQVSVAFRDRWA